MFQSSPYTPVWFLLTRLRLFHFSNRFLCLAEDGWHPIPESQRIPSPSSF